MAVGWAKDDAVNDQIQDSVNDEVRRAREALPRGESLEFCEDCGEEIPQARRDALPGVRLCVPCQEEAEKAIHASAFITARAARTASCASLPPSLPDRAPLIRNLEQAAKVLAGQGKLLRRDWRHIGRPRALHVIAFFNYDKRGCHLAHDAKEARGIPAMFLHPVPGPWRKEKIRLAIAQCGMGVFFLAVCPAAKLGQNFNKGQKLFFCNRRLPFIDG